MRSLPRHAHVSTLLKPAHRSAIFRCFAFRLFTYYVNGNGTMESIAVLRKQSFPYIQLLIFVAGLRSLKFVQKQHLVPHGKASLPHFLKIPTLLLHPQYRFPLSGTAPQLQIDFFIHPRNKLPQNFTVPLTVLRECFFL